MSQHIRTLKVDYSRGTTDLTADFTEIDGLGVCGATTLLGSVTAGVMELLHTLEHLIANVPEATTTVPIELEATTLFGKVTGMVTVPDTCSEQLINKIKTGFAEQLPRLIVPEFQQQLTNVLVPAMDEIFGAPGDRGPFGPSMPFGDGDLMIELIPIGLEAPASGPSTRRFGLFGR